MKKSLRKVGYIIIPFCMLINIFSNTIAVLISVTPDEHLREYEQFMIDNYRNDIYNYLYNEGLKYLNNPNNTPTWKHIILNKNDLKIFCNNKSNNFIKHQFQNLLLY